jgi:hypothetical protein
MPPHLILLFSRLLSRHRLAFSIYLLKSRMPMNRRYVFLIFCCYFRASYLKTNLNYLFVRLEMTEKSSWYANIHVFISLLQFIWSLLNCSLLNLSIGECAWTAPLWWWQKWHTCHQ